MGRLCLAVVLVAGCTKTNIDRSNRNCGPGGICVEGFFCNTVNNICQTASEICVDSDQDGLGNGTGGNAGCINPTTDSNDRNTNACSDVDGDGCDDCSTGLFDPSNDGPDTDMDGQCELCTDNDGDGLGDGTDGNVGCASTVTDSNDNDSSACADTDLDTCDDCTNNSFDPNNDGSDRDSDGTCDATDTCDDTDGDGVGTGIGPSTGCLTLVIDSNDALGTVCADTDNDTCDDCDSGTFNTLADGTDSDMDGRCDAAPPCADFDGDGVGNGTGGNTACVTTETDLNDMNSSVCLDTDMDGCDDCSSMMFNPAMDGTDGDGDGICNVTDTCDDADGDDVGSGVNGNTGCATTVDDMAPAVPTSCADTDMDGCDDCSSGTFDPMLDGTDSDGDGICDVTDDCNDADGDNVGTGLNGNAGCATTLDDGNDGNDQQCLDTDNDGCDDCRSTTFNPGMDGTDGDGDGICAMGDCNDNNPNCELQCADDDRDGFCVDFDCDDSIPDCTTDCATNTDGSGEMPPTPDCLETFCGSDPAVQGSACLMPTDPASLNAAIVAANGSDQRILLTDMVVLVPPAIITGNDNEFRQRAGTVINVISSGLFTLFRSDGDRNLFEGLSISGNPNDAFRIRGNDVSVVNTVVDGFRARGIWIDTADRALVAGCVITGSNLPPLLLRGSIVLNASNDSAIVSNILTGSGVAGIQIDGSNRAFIDHNTIADNTAAAIDIIGSPLNNLCIRNNNITGNPVALQSASMSLGWATVGECVNPNGMAAPPPLPAGPLYGNNEFNTAACGGSQCGGCSCLPAGTLFQYSTNPMYPSTTLGNPTYYCLGAASLHDAGHDLGYDRNGAQMNDFNGGDPAVGAREEGAFGCP